MRSFETLARYRLFVLPLLTVCGFACSKKQSQPSVPANAPNPVNVDKPQSGSSPQISGKNEKEAVLAEAKKKLDADVERVVPKGPPEPVPTSEFVKDAVYEEFPQDYVAAATKRGYPALNVPISRWAFGQSHVVTDKEPRPKDLPPEMTVPPFFTQLDDSIFAKEHFPVSPVACKLITRADITPKLAVELALQVNVISLEIDFANAKAIEHLECFAALPKLKAVSFQNAKKEDLSKVLVWFKNVTSLSVKGGVFDKSHAEYVAKAMKLEQLSADGYNAPLTDEVIAEISKISTLKALRLRSSGDSKVTSVSGFSISRLSRLEELDLAGIGSFSVEGWAPISRLTRLRKLAITGFDSGFGMYDKYNIFRTPLVIDALKPLVNLQTLVISNVHTFGNGDFAKLGQFPKLETLCLTYAANMDDKMLDELNAVKQLKVLRISSTKKISDAAVSKFKKEHPDCEVHWKKSDF